MFITGSAPVTGTVPGTGGMGRACGLMLGWWRIVANQPIWCTTLSGSHARAIRAATAARAARDLRTAHLLRTRAAQQRLHLARARRLARHEDTELVVREARIVGHRAEPARGEQRIEENAEDGREGAEQDRHLEHDHDVGRDRADGLATQDDQPVVRHVQGDPGADGAARDAADEGEHPDRAHRLVERVFDLVSGNRRIHGEVGVPAGAESSDRVHRGVDMPEHRQHAGRGRWMKDRGQRVHELHEAATFPRRGAGRTSFTSEIETAGKIFTNKRNHMKNHPKLPAMTPQSRSEEHTSELQSHVNLVCRLLLEKKKPNKHYAPVALHSSNAASQSLSALSSWRPPAILNTHPSFLSCRGNSTHRESPYEGAKLPA